MKSGFYLLDSKDGTRMFMDPYPPQDEVVVKTRVLTGLNYPAPLGMLCLRIAER